MRSSTARRGAHAALLCLPFAFALLAAAPPAARAQPPLPAAPHAAPAERRGVLNINTADLEQLQQLPGIGPVKARAILEYRRARGPFRSVEELERVRGIGPRAVQRLRPLCATEGVSTLSAQR